MSSEPLLRWEGGHCVQGSLRETEGRVETVGDKEGAAKRPTPFKGRVRAARVGPCFLGWKETRTLTVLPLGGR